MSLTNEHSWHISCTSEFDIHPYTFAATRTSDWAPYFRSSGFFIEPLPLSSKASRMTVRHKHLSAMTMFLLQYNCKSLQITLVSNQ